MNIRLDLKIITIGLLIVIVAMLTIWKPWEGISKRTISVTGQATVQAAPDEFQFYPVYSKTAATSQQAISDVSKVGNEVVAKLKEMGVKSEDLKTSVNTNQGYEPLTGKQTSDFNATYSVTATVHNKDLAQKILDYIATTPTLYGVSPASTFSKAKQKELESQARAKAVADAKEKAKVSADELGVKVGSVVSVSDPVQFGGPVMLEGKAVPAVADTKQTIAPVLETGIQDLSFSVTVVFKIK